MIGRNEQLKLIWHEINRRHASTLLSYKKMYSVKFKLNGKRLFPISSVKFLGVFFDQQLCWNKQLAHVTAKLSQGIDILLKLMHSANLNILKIVYHSLVVSHLHYGSQIWGQRNTENINKMHVLQNRALRKSPLKGSLNQQTKYTRISKY